MEPVRRMDAAVMSNNNLVFDLVGALYAGDKRHAQDAMRELGITYLIAVPQSICACWWFFRCENIPAELPSYITRRVFKHKELVGWGLSDEDVAKIDEYDAKAPPASDARERGE